MPRDPTYHDVEKLRRHALKPYDRDASDNQVVLSDDDFSDVEPANDVEKSNGDDDAGSADDSSDTETNSDRDSDSEKDASDVQDAIDDEVEYEEDEDMQKPINIFNPSGSRVNCTDMGQSYASGLSNEYSPHEKRLRKKGFKVSDNPPDEEYLSGPREAAVAYRHAGGGGHVVAMDGGYNDATYTYSNHQIRVDEDVTEEVNGARRDGHIAIYVMRPNFDDRDREQEQDDDYEDCEEEEEGGEDYGDDRDYEMDNGWNKYR